MLLAAAATAVLGVVTTWLSNLIGQRVLHDLRVSVYAHLQRMSLRFFTRTRAGELQSRLANDVGGIDNVVTNTATSTVQNVFAGLSVGIAALVMEWKLACICLVVIPLFLLFTLRLGRKRRAIARGRQKRLAGITGLVEESLSVAGVLLTKTLGRQHTLTERFENESRELSDTEMRAAMSGRWILSSRRASLTMIPAIVYWIAGIALAHGSAPITIGTAVAFTSMLNRLVAPATALQSIGVQISTSVALFVRIFEMLDLPVDIDESPDAVRLSDVRGDVGLDHVSFRYDADARWTLRDIDLVVPAGTTTAIVGETGSGKTTLAYLVARLYDADEGAVCVDGVDVRRLSLDTVSDAMGLVARDTYLFHDTVAANLRFASRPRWTNWPRAVPRSPLRTACRPCATPIRSWCSTAARSSNAARTPSCSHEPAATPSWPANSSEPDCATPGGVTPPRVAQSGQAARKTRISPLPVRARIVSGSPLEMEDVGSFSMGRSDVTRPEPVVTSSRAG
jgi:ATP-binding cassette, subfamily B, bacterial